MQLCIPTIGTKLILEKDWTVSIHDEYRNSNFIKKLIDTGLFTPKAKPSSRYYGDGSVLGRFTLPAGSVLTVSRIYIRQGKGEFDSITFSVAFKLPSKKKLTGRFWAKLEEVNTIEYTTDLTKATETVNVVLESQDFI